MALTISPLHGASRRELEPFLSLPARIYPRESPYVPPLRFQERELLTPGRHPFWLSARRRLFMAWRDGRPVGRIAAIVDEKHNAYAGEKCGAFGFFECEDDTEAAHGLLEAARDWLDGEGMNFMRGPLNPSSNYTCGMLVQGFEHAPAIMMPWNHPYYPRLLESWRMRKEQDLFAYHIRRETAEPTPELAREIAAVKAQGRFTWRTASRKSMDDDIRAMLRIYRESWADNWNFSPLSEAEATQLVRDLRSIVNPDFFVLFFHEGVAVAGMVALPDLNPLLKKLNGRLLPAGPWHWWHMRRQLQKGYRIMLFGIVPRYRLLGLPLLLLDHLLAQARQNPDLEWVEGSWVLEDNTAICDLIEDFSGVISKRYRIYRRNIDKAEAVWMP